MKKFGLLFIVFLLVAGILSNDSFAQAYTHWHLPEGAIARLGKGKINDAKFSPDGSQLAIASDIGVWVYDAENGTEIALLTGQIDGSLVAKAIAFAPDGKTLAVGSPRTIELWDIKTRQRLSTFKMSSVHDLKFSQDSEMLACVSWSKGVEYAMWEIASRRELFRFKTSQDSIPANRSALVLSEDAHSIASTSVNSVFVWDVFTEAQQHAFEGDENLAWSLAFSPDGKTLAGGYTTIRLWDTETGDELSILEGHTRILDAITFSPDGRILASGDTGGKIMLSNFDPQNQKLNNQKPTLPHLLRSLTGSKMPKHENRTLTEHTLPIKALDFTADSKKLVSGSHDGTAKVWDVKTGNSILTLPGHTGSVNALQFFENGKVLCTGSSDGIVRIWDVTARTEQIIHTRPPWLAFATAFSSDRKMVASACWSEVRIWDTNTQSFLEPLTGHERFVLTVAFSPDNKRLASGSREGRVILWDVPNHRHHSTYDVHTDEVNAVTFSPDGKKFASASKDGTVYLYDLHTQEKTKLLTEPNRGVNEIVFSPDSSTLLSGRWDGEMQLWDVETHQHIANFIDARGTIDGLAFSPDGKMVVTGLHGGLIRIWDVETRTLVHRFRTGNASSPTNFTFTPDSKTLVSGGWDGTVLVWNLEDILEKNR